MLQRAKIVGPRSLLLFGVAIGLTVGCGGSVQTSQQPEDDDWTQEDSTSPIIGSEFSAPASAVQAYGQLATQNSGLTCPSASGSAGLMVLLQCSTGRVVSVAGLVAHGPISLSPETGEGKLAVGTAAQWDPQSKKIDLGGAALGQYTLDMGTEMPADGEAATILFDQAFGAAARYGTSLDKVVMGRRGATIAYYGIGTANLPDDDGAVRAVLAVGVVRYQGRVLALQTTGLGALASYAK